MAAAAAAAATSGTHTRIVFFWITDFTIFFLILFQSRCVCVCYGIKIDFNMNTVMIMKGNYSFLFLFSFFLFMIKTKIYETMNSIIIWLFAWSQVAKIKLKSKNLCLLFSLLLFIVVFGGIDFFFVLKIFKHHFLES